MSDIRDFGPEAVLEFKTIVVVAVKGYGQDWAAYWSEGSLEPMFESIDHHMTPSEVVKLGNKLPENVAKNEFFPQIGGGPYRS